MICVHCLAWKPQNTYIASMMHAHSMSILHWMPEITSMWQYSIAFTGNSNIKLS